MAARHASSRGRTLETMATEKFTPSIRVTFMGELLSLIGQRDLQVNLRRGATVGDLLESLTNTYGDAFTRRVFRGPGRLHHTMLTFVGGGNIKESGGLAW